MIRINRKTECCGCSACEQICPRKCISMSEDNEGFLYPKVDTDLCTDCHLCEKVCPVINRFDSAPQPISFAARTNDEILRSKSSSGGLFTELAVEIISKGGVVFGAKFADDWTVVHDYTETADGLWAFRGSKYVQSRIGNAFIKVREFLKAGRIVLFTGTPCQVSGLNHFLGKKHENLITMDMVCHSISSPKVWRKYLEEIKGSSCIENITFRDKETFGWRNYGLRIDGKLEGSPIRLVCGGHNKTKDANLFMRGFVNDLITRPSCSECPARNYTSGSDLMLADFWHLEQYHPEWDDNKGMSLVLVLTDKGRNLLDRVKNNVICEGVKYLEVEDNAVHAPITMSCQPNRYRNHFFEEIDSFNVIELLECYLSKSDRHNSIINTLKFVYKLLGLTFIKKLCRTVIRK